MSREPGDRRYGRRRLFVYRPSPDSLTPPTIQTKRPWPSNTAPSREQEAAGSWQLHPSRQQEAAGSWQLHPSREKEAAGSWQLCPSGEKEAAGSWQLHPSREQEAAGSWHLPPLTTLESSSQEVFLPLRGGATAAQRDFPLPSTPHRARASPGQQLPYLLASPLERTSNRILSVELDDITRQEPLCLAKPLPDGRLSAGEGEELAVGSSWSPGGEKMSAQRCSVRQPAELSGCASADIPGSDGLPLSTDTPSTHSQDSPQPPPPRVPKWGLIPLLHNVRTKLESFAEIFLSPMKSRRESQHSLHNQPVTEIQHSDPPGENDGLSEHPTEDASDSAPCSPPGAAAQPLLPSARGMNLQLKIEIHNRASSLCRPPLQRCFSCPLLPNRLRRHSLEVAEQSDTVCSCRAHTPQRRRRHSMGTIEECRKLPLSPVSFTCLRKEKHPFALWPSRSPAEHAPPCANSSPPGCLDEQRVRETAVSMGGDDVSQQSPAPSGCKEIKETKVSAIQIRKRATRQEGNLTPLGLPKRIRLQKDDFSLEEIYTNKNYHTPTEKRKFETIFEEPVMKGGALILTSQRPLRRIMVFKDGGAPRRRKKKGRGGGRTRSCANSSREVNIELLLRQKLDQLEAALQHDEEVELL